MNHYEMPLVLFTVLCQSAIGLVAVNAFRQVSGPDMEPRRIRLEWLAAGLVLITGLIASVFHLGHPSGMVRALNNLGTAWLSREALTVGIFLALLAAGLLLMREKSNPVLAVTTAAAGLLVILSMGMTYSPPSFPAINNVLPFVFFCLTALLLGSSAGQLFANENSRPMMTRILTATLIVALVIYLIVPCIWLSGGEIMKLTAEQWLASPLYWGRIIIGLALPLVLIKALGKTPAWLWGLLLAGELMGRALFFAGTVHTAVNMGGVY
ncbi:MAG TPA: molybdopterin-containing oxidoreductase membrane anchor subunit [Desulfobacteraceae bacterium]|nr:molybdopterin-containing oxidoreductase membrane anchor subunit [Desulfobacteraceae bacterium]